MAKSNGTYGSSSGNYVTYSNNTSGSVVNTINTNYVAPGTPGWNTASIKYFITNENEITDVYNGKMPLEDAIKLVSEALAHMKYDKNQLFEDSTKKECIRVLTKIIIEGKVLTRDAEENGFY